MKKVYNKEFLESPPKKRISDLLEAVLKIKDKDKFIIVLSKDEKEVSIDYLLVDEFSWDDMRRSLNFVMKFLDDSIENKEIIHGEEYENNA